MILYILVRYCLRIDVVLSIGLAMRVESGIAHRRMKNRQGDGIHMYPYIYIYIYIAGGVLDQGVYWIRGGLHNLYFTC